MQTHTNIIILAGCLWKWVLGSKRAFAWPPQLLASIKRHNYFTKGVCSKEKAVALGWGPWGTLFLYFQCKALGLVHTYFVLLSSQSVWIHQLCVAASEWCSISWWRGHVSIFGGTWRCPASDCGCKVSPGTAGGPCGVKGARLYSWLILKDKLAFFQSGWSGKQDWGWFSELCDYIDNPPVSSNQRERCGTRQARVSKVCWRLVVPPRSLPCQKLFQFHR